MSIIITIICFTEPLNWNPYYLPFEVFRVLFFLNLIITVLLIFNVNILNKKIHKIQFKRLLLEDSFRTISHDLKTPLTSYQDLAETIKFLLDKKEFDRIPLISKQINKMGQAIYEMLENLNGWVLGIESKRSEKRVVYLEVFFQNIVNVYGGVAELRNIDFNVEYDPKDYIYINSNSLGIIIRNVLDNALKNTPCGGLVLLRVIKTDKLIIKVTNQILETEKYKIKEIDNFLKNKPTSIQIGLGLRLISRYSKQVGFRANAYINQNNLACLELESTYTL